MGVSSNPETLMVLFLAVAVVFLSWFVSRLNDAKDDQNSSLEKLRVELEAMNKRLVDLETDRSTVAPREKNQSDDPLGAPSSWLSQAALAERYEGVRL